MIKKTLILTFYFSIILIISGWLINSFWGIRGGVSIYQGYAADRIFYKDNITIKLPFKVYLEKFIVKHYDSTNIVKDYKSHIFIINRNKKIQYFKIIGINNPLKYKGYYIYQFSYDKDNQEWVEFYIKKDPGIIFVTIGAVLIIFSTFMLFGLNYLIR